MTQPSTAPLPESGKPKLLYREVAEAEEEPVRRDGDSLMSEVREG